MGPNDADPLISVTEPKAKDLGVVFSGQAKRIRVTVCDEGIGTSTNWVFSLVISIILPIVNLCAASATTSQEVPPETYLQGAHGVAFGEFLHGLYA